MGSSVIGRAMDLLNQQAYRLVFLDLDLGEDSPLDGFALCHQIRQRWRHGGSDLPTIVIVSAFHDPVHQVRATLAGAQRFLGKPLDGEALAATLRNLTAMPANPSTA
jgi:DNA-binding response OmpR family regulator